MLSSQTLLGTSPLLKEESLDSPPSPPYHLCYSPSPLPPPPPSTTSITSQPPTTSTCNHEFTEAGLLETFSNAQEFKELLAVSERLYCQENVLFYDRITELLELALISKVPPTKDALLDIYNNYILPGSEYELNLSLEIRKQLMEIFSTSLATNNTLEQQVDWRIFEKAKDEVFSMIFLNVYPVYLSRFQRQATPSNHPSAPSTSATLRLIKSPTSNSILKRASAVSLKSWRKNISSNVFGPIDLNDSPIGSTGSGGRRLRKQESCSDFKPTTTRQMSLDYSSFSLERQDTFDERSCYSVESQYILPTLGNEGSRSSFKVGSENNSAYATGKLRENNVFKRLIRKFKSLNIP